LPKSKTINGFNEEASKIKSTLSTGENSLFFKRSSLSCINALISLSAIAQPKAELCP
jgi:hypothetical protein